jgi:hypothetical protein
VGIALDEQLIMLPQRIQLRRAVRSEEAVTNNPGKIEYNRSTTQRAEGDRAAIFYPILRWPAYELSIR